MPNTSNEPTPNGDDSFNPKAHPFPSADTVKFNLEKSGATIAQITSALWLLDYGRTHRLPTYKALGAVIGRDASAVSKLFAGTYGADLAKLTAHIDNVRTAAAAREGFGERIIVETSVIRDVKTLCDMTRASQTLSMIYDDRLSGKTVALKYYTQENNHGQTVYVSVPVGGSAKMFMSALLKACGISERNSYDQMRDRALKFFGYRGPRVPSAGAHLLLIVDNLHNAVTGRALKTITLALIHEIHELCGCGVVIAGRTALADALKADRNREKLGQIADLNVLTFRIPDVPLAADLETICGAYGFVDPDEKSARHVAEIAGRHGIGQLCGYLRMAKKLASNRHQTAGWNHFLSTHATLKAWARGERKPGKAQLSGGAKSPPKQLGSGAEGSAE